MLFSGYLGAKVVIAKVAANLLLRTRHPPARPKRILTARGQLLEDACRTPLFQRSPPSDKRMSLRIDAAAWRCNLRSQFEP